MAFTKLGLYIDRGRLNTVTNQTGVFARHRYQNNVDTLATIAAASYFPDYLDQDDVAVQIGDLLDVKGSDDYRTYKITAVSPLTVVEEVLGDNPFNQSLNTGDNVQFVDITAQDITCATLSASGNISGAINSTNGTITTLASTTATLGTAIITTGSVSGSLNVTGGANLTVTSGDLAVNSGDVTLTSGNLLLPTVGGTPSNFNYYEETVAVVLTYAGPFAAGGNVNAYFTRIGRLVNILIQEIVVPAGGATNQIVLTGIPDRFKVPSTGGGENMIIPVSIINNDVVETGRAIFTRDGTDNDKIFIERENGANFTATNNNGFDWMPLTFPVGV